MQSFVQSYENRTILDSSILIAPLVFFIGPNDPRFLQTLDKILLPPDRGGLTSTGLVYRYDTELSQDGKSVQPPPSAEHENITHQLNQALEVARALSACAPSG
jgi:GH15 family glucan-1,4-alpha-glucosidase